MTDKTVFAVVLLLCRLFLTSISTNINLFTRLFQWLSLKLEFHESSFPRSILVTSSRIDRGIIDNLVGLYKLTASSVVEKTLIFGELCSNFWA